MYYNYSNLSSCDKILIVSGKTNQSECSREGKKTGRQQTEEKVTIFLVTFSKNIFLLCSVHKLILMEKSYKHYSKITRDLFCYKCPSVRA